MQMMLRIAARRESRQAFAHDPAIATAFDASALVFEVEIRAPVMARLVEVAGKADGMWAHPYFRFSAAEIAGAAWLQLEARGRIIRETAAEAAYNRAVLEALPLIRARPETAIRLPEGLALKRIKLPPGRVGAATDWLPEWVIADSVAGLFSAAGLSGWELKPFLDRQQDLPVPGYAQLFTHQLMPWALIDRSTPPSELPGEGWRQGGCLSYPAGALATVGGDFARTAENWDANRVPVWTVSGRVVRCCAQNNIKGWAYRPALEQGTAMHQEYLCRWNELLDRVAPYPNILV